MSCCGPMFDEKPQKQARLSYKTGWLQHEPDFLLHRSKFQTALQVLGYRIREFSLSHLYVSLDPTKLVLFSRRL
jgi:hypothetical protein